MDTWHIVLGLVALAAAGAAVALLVGRQRLVASESEARATSALARAELERETQRGREAMEAEHARQRELARTLGEAQDELGRLRVEIATLVTQRDADRARLQDELRQKDELLEVERAALRKREQQMHEDVNKRLAELNQKFASEFDALASRALKVANDEFMKRAEERLGAQQKQAAGEIEEKRKAVEALVKPIAETLSKTDKKLDEIERARIATSASIREQLAGVSEAHTTLRAETEKLVRALREPHVRGMYGEVQLRRVAELAGMRSYCDFAEQSTTRDAEGNTLRPDMVVRLPAGRELVVDAKANLRPYLDALEARDPQRAEEHLRIFADGIANQASLLAKKGYWSQYDGSPEFVIMFVPGDQFVDAALAKRPDLLELAASQRVILASPSTLIGLLRAVQVGFMEQRLAQEARELLDLGKELHQRAAAAMGHAEKLGRALNLAVDSYNRFVGSYQSRLEPTFRKFEEAGAKGGELPELKVLEPQARLLPRATSDGQGSLIDA